MDPKQTLIDADQAISELEFSAAIDRLNNYFSWRLNGGFEPTLDAMRGSTSRGDSVAAHLMIALSDHVESC
jgi:hypothetical protein